MTEPLSVGQIAKHRACAPFVSPPDPIYQLCDSHERLRQQVADQATEIAKLKEELATAEQRLTPRMFAGLATCLKEEAERCVRAEREIARLTEERDKARDAATDSSRAATTIDALARALARIRAVAVSEREVPPDEEADVLDLVTDLRDAYVVSRQSLAEARAEIAKLKDERIKLSEAYHEATLATVAEWRANYATAEARGVQQGRAQVLARVRKLPAPWHEECVSADPEKDEASVRGRCDWCYAIVDWHGTNADFYGARLPKTAHPPNDCLYALAHAERQAPE